MGYYLSLRAPSRRLIRCVAHDFVCPAALLYALHGGVGEIGSLKGVSRSMFGTFGAQIAAPSSSRPNFAAGVPARCPHPFLPRRFHWSVALRESRSYCIRSPIEPNKVSLESSREVRVPQTCAFLDLAVLARREILGALNRCRTSGYIREIFGANGGRLGPRN